jgi:hypothetical protein
MRRASEAAPSGWAGSAASKPSASFTGALTSASRACPSSQAIALAHDPELPLVA